MREPAAGTGSGWGESRPWDRHPRLALALRLAIFVVPVLLALATSILLSRTLPRPTTWWQLVLWWTGIVAATLMVLIAADRLCRRALPLAALLELSLLFPDRAPDRFRIWRRGGSVAQLRAELERLSSGGDGQGPEAAQRVLTLVAELSVHDPRTRGHAERVRILTDMLAEEMRLPERDRHMLRWASLLHDIGKLNVSGDILRKESAPDDAEWRALRSHPEEGDRLLGPVRGWLGPWALTVEQHHEHYDGSGYPRGLRGEEISLGARIVGLTDAFEAMTARRPYSRPVSPSAAREELVRRAGSHFDPEVCRAFLSISVGRLWRAVGVAAGVAEVPLAATITGASGRVGPTATSAGTVAVAGTLAAAVGLLPLVGIQNITGHGRSAVAGLHSPRPSAPPLVALGTPLPAQPSPAPPVVPAAPVAVSFTAPDVAAVAPAVPRSGGGAAAPAGHQSVTFTVRPGSVHHDAPYSLTGQLSSSCAGCIVRVSWGDGSAMQTAALSRGNFSGAHTFANKGRYVVSVTVWSAGRAVGSASLRVVVNNG